MEVLVALSVVTSLVVIGLSVFQPVRQSIDQAECRSQLVDIGQALEKYREDHRGQDPPGLERLVPAYLPERALICPVNRSRAPAAVAEAQRIMRPTPFRYWSSYFYFSRIALDRLYRQGHITVGYTQVLHQRLGETPVAVCFDHREPWSLRLKSQATPHMEEVWYYPERPQIVLRRNLRVDAVRYGGLERDGTSMDTDAQLVGL